MRKSNELIREQAELAFDNAFGKPCKSRRIRKIVKMALFKIKQQLEYIKEKPFKLRKKYKT